MTTERPDRPFILVTNDDGIEADGIWYLAAPSLRAGWTVSDAGVHSGPLTLRR